MSSPEDIFRQIENDRAVREREIRLVGNAARRTTNDSEKQMLFRSSILLTYAHLEGFCRFALTAYVSAINSLGLTCKEAAFPVVAASLSPLFNALRHPQSKHPFFSQLLPDDAKLHLMAREREFVEKINAAMDEKVNMADDIIDTESNLSPIVLMKNLFKLGLHYALSDDRRSSLNRLLGVRNSIAHGDMLKMPEEKEVDEYVSSAFSAMGTVQTEVYNALRGKAYLRETQDVPPEAD